MVEWEHEIVDEWRVIDESNEESLSGEESDQKGGNEVKERRG
jgi:hypothetical protein